MVVGQCVDGTQVASAVEDLRPDVVVLDVRMPHLSGLDIAATLRQTQPPLRVVILTCDPSGSSRSAARASHVAAYLLKGAEPGLLLAAPRQAESSTVREPG